MQLQRRRKGTVIKVDVRQSDNVKFSIRARQHTVICDQPTDNGGLDEGMTPPELLLASLGSCAAFYAVQYLKTRNLSSGAVEVSVRAEKLKNPARLGHFQIEVRCPEVLTNEQQQCMLRSVHACLIHNTLMSVPDIEIVVKTPELVG